MRLTGGALTGVGLVVLVASAVLDPERTAHAWLWAWTYTVNVALGCLFLVMITHVAPVGFLGALRRPLTAAAATLPVLGLGLVPVLAAADLLYPWSGPLPPHAGHHAEHAIEHMAPWMNLPFFAVRGLLFFSLWTTFAWTLRRLATGGAPDAVRHGRRVSALGLPLCALTWTFASFDWGMSLQAPWLSHVYGVHWFAQGMLGAVALAVLAALALQRRLDEAELPSDLFHALARLMHGFVIFWAYIAFSGVFVVWITNLPHEAPYWIQRFDGGWLAVTWVLALGAFALPFLLLLSRRWKRDGRFVGGLAAWLLLMMALDALYLVVPAASRAAAHPADLGALLLFAGMALLVLPLLWGREGADPLLHETLSYRSRV